MLQGFKFRTLCNVISIFLPPSIQFGNTRVCYYNGLRRDGKHVKLTSGNFGYQLTC